MKKFVRVALGKIDDIVWIQQNGLFPANIDESKNISTIYFDGTKKY